MFEQEAPEDTPFTKAIRNILLRRVLALLGSFLLSCGSELLVGNAVDRTWLLDDSGDNRILK